MDTSITFHSFLPTTDTTAPSFQDMIGNNSDVLRLCCQCYWREYLFQTLFL